MAPAIGLAFPRLQHVRACAVIPFRSPIYPEWRVSRCAAELGVVQKDIAYRWEAGTKPPMPPWGRS